MRDRKRPDPPALPLAKTWHSRSTCRLRPDRRKQRADRARRIGPTHWGSPWAPISSELSHRRNVHTGVIKSLSEAVHSTAGGRKRPRLLCRDGAANLVATKEQRHDRTSSTATAALLDDRLTDHCRSIERLPCDYRRDSAGPRARLRRDHRRARP